MADGVLFKLTDRRPPISLDGYRRAARRALPEMIWTYVDGGAETMTTLRGIRSAFDRWRLRQRALVGPNPCETGVSLDGVALSMPVALAPTGLTGLVHWQGDVGAARAAESHGTRLVLSGCAPNVTAASSNRHSNSRSGDRPRQSPHIARNPGGAARCKRRVRELKKTCK